MLVSLLLLSASYIYSITYEMDSLNTGARRLCGAGGQLYGLSLRQSFAFNFLLNVYISVTTH